MNGHGQGIVTSRRSFDREKQKEYYMPIIMKDSGQPQVTGTNTLTIIIGDKNDNVHYPGHKEIFVYNYRGEIFPSHFFRPRFFLFVGLHHTFRNFKVRRSGKK